MATDDDTPTVSLRPVCVAASGGSGGGVSGSVAPVEAASVPTQAVNYAARWLREYTPWVIEGPSDVDPSRAAAVPTIAAPGLSALDGPLPSWKLPAVTEVLSQLCGTGTGRSLSQLNCAITSSVLPRPPLPHSITIGFCSESWTGPAMEDPFTLSYSLYKTWAKGHGGVVVRQVASNGVGGTPFTVAAVLLSSDLCDAADEYVATSIVQGVLLALGLPLSQHFDPFDALYRGALFHIPVSDPRLHLPREALVAL